MLLDEVEELSILSQLQNEVWGRKRESGEMMSERVASLNSSSAMIEGLVTHKETLCPGKSSKD